MARADKQGLDYDRGGELAKRTGRGGVVGGAGGAAAGAIHGNAGRGAATGAVAGATHGLLHGLFAADSPHPVYRRFVDTCLREKGYQPIGWQ